MLRHITTSLMAGAIALTTAATPVAADEGDELIIGAIVLGIIGLALNNSDSGSVRVDTDRSNRPREITPLSQNNRVRPQRVQRGLPAMCLQRYETRRGDVRMFDAGCLARSYRDYDRLPHQCEARVRTRRGFDTGFDPRCLRDAGYRLAGR